MKKLIILLFALVMVNYTMAQWFPQNSGTTKRLKDVYFTNVDTGYVGGTRIFDGNPAIMLKTTDGGINWSMILWYIPSYWVGYGISDIQFLNTNTGYALGYLNHSSGGSGPILFKTVNGGINWTVNSLYQTFPVGLSSIFFTSIDTGYAVGVESNGSIDWIILKTTNGGIDWTTTNSWVQWNDAGLYSVYFPGANTGYAVGRNGWESGLILKTTNGGTDWIEQSSGISQGLNSVYFIHEDTGYIVGGNGTILKTTNGGCNPVGINSNLQTTNYNLYPNPANKSVTINPIEEETIDELIIYNQTGQKVHSRIPENNTLDISKLQPGMYVVDVATKKGNVRRKLIVQ